MAGWLWNLSRLCLIQNIYWGIFDLTHFLKIKVSFLINLKSSEPMLVFGYFKFKHGVAWS
ncbi:hypothetical protein [Campylobacter concisus]|uniref:hypothetical protein n=1 Tax=Campylobacter concisus TaxID=199 RepID=UPI0011E6DA27|nr:hypothetical protein [Campylobacter concisus]